MRLGETAREEKWLTLEPAKLLDGFVRNMIVVVGLTVAGQHDPTVRASFALAGVGVAQFAFGHRLLRLHDLVGQADGDDAGGMPFRGEPGFFRGVRLAADARQPARVAAVHPGVGVVNAVVENFTRARGDVAMILEIARQAHKLRMQIAEPGAVAEHAGFRWPAAVQHGRTRRIAQRVLRVSPVEPHAGGCQLVQVRCLRQAAITTDFRAQIVGDEEQHIVARRRIRGGGQHRRNTADRNSQKHNNIFHG